MAKKLSVRIEETENKARLQIREHLLMSARDGELGPPGSAMSDLSMSDLSRSGLDDDSINKLFSILNELFKKQQPHFAGSPFHDNEWYRVTAAYMLERSVPPSPWRDYILIMLRHTRPVLRTGAKHVWRNIILTLCVELGRAAGLDPTRGRHQRYTNGAHSTCSLVADELKAFGMHLSEDAVEKIWRQTAPRLFGSRRKKLSPVSDGK